MILAVVVLVILVVTLLPSPNSPSTPFSLHLVLEPRWLADGILNVCLFVPLGLAAGWNSRSTLKAALAGLLLSTAIELTQTIVPGRDPALSDIVFNTIGSVLGALIAHRPYRWLAPDSTRSLALTALGIGAAATVMTATAFLLSPIPSSSTERLPIFVNRVGDDLLLRYEARANLLGLDEPEYWAPGAFRGSPTTSVPVSVSRERARWHITIGAGEVVTLGPTVGRGWTLLAYPDAIARRWSALVSGIWVSLLLLPIGFWARAWLRPIAAVTVIAMLVLIPRFAGIVDTGWAEWVGGAFGFLGGALLASLLARPLRIHEKNGRLDSAPL